MTIMQETNFADSPESPTMAQDVISEVDNYDEIAALAYRFWIERGSPLGSPDEDWFRAEAEIRSCKSYTAAP